MKYNRGGTFFSGDKEPCFQPGNLETTQVDGGFCTVHHCCSIWTL